jgi:hypothetical protein
VPAVLLPIATGARTLNSIAANQSKINELTLAEESVCLMDRCRHMRSYYFVCCLFSLAATGQLATTAAVAEPDAKILGMAKERAALAAKSFPLGRYQRREYATDDKGVPKGAATAAEFVCIKAVAHIEAMMISPILQGAMALELSQSMGGACQQAVRVLDGGVITSEMVCDWTVKATTPGKKSPPQTTQTRFMHSAGAVSGKEIQVLTREYRTQGGAAKMTEGGMVQLVPMGSACEAGDETSGGLLAQ